MNDIVSVNVKSITTQRVQKLYLDGAKAKLLKDKNVLIVDDVISTGESLEALKALCKSAGGHTVCCASVLAEGDASERDDIVFLEKLPLFT